MTSWPEWWDWELEFSAQADGRSRLLGDRPSHDDGARTGLRQDAEPGRWIVETRHDSGVWQVIVEPDTIDELLVVISAFPVSP